MNPVTSNALTPIPDEDKLGHALVSRGLLSSEDFQLFRQADKKAAGSRTLEEYLQRLVAQGFLTKRQAARVAPEMPLLLNQQIPGYQLMQKLGQGSMGTVFKAKQLSMNRMVAVKVLNAKFAANKEFLDRFQREAHLAAQFSSNNVVQAIDVGTAGNIHYFVMEFVEGTTIKDEIEKGKIFEEKEAIHLVLQVAQALENAHRRQLIHRDVKPANIMLTPEGIAKLADLGMARNTTDTALAQAEKGQTIGTPYYIAPEQINSRTDVDSRADIYSLGATFYHMVTGQPPFNHTKISDVLRAHLEEELTPPDHLNAKLSSGLGEVVEFMMARKRDKRYPSPVELIADLESILQGNPPKYARQKMQTSTLEQLAEGEAVDDPPATSPTLWLALLGGALGISLLVNIVLALRGRG